MQRTTTWLTAIPSSWARQKRSSARAGMDFVSYMEVPRCSRQCSRSAEVRLRPVLRPSESQIYGCGMSNHVMRIAGTR